MKVLFLNTSEQTGGAAVAAGRIMRALREKGVEARMLVRDRSTSDPHVLSLTPSWRLRRNFLWERLVIWGANRFSRRNLFAVDIANAGTDVTRRPEFREADVIHLHWINQGYLSLHSLERILRSGKPVVWTMHDMWPATSLCHHARECTAFHTECRTCPFLGEHRLPVDLARRVFRRKAALYRGAPLSFVTCSHWLREQASRSALLQGKEITAIPNPIDPAAFRPQDKAAARKHWGTLLPGGQRLILFGACRFTDKRKGIDYFIDSCRILAHRRPEWAGKVGIALFGQGDGQQLAREIPYPVYPLGQLRSGEEMALAYNAADLFVTPSLEENLPYTIMEAIACGLPCAGFRIGGIPEMIDHKRNGFLADYKSAEDLAAGMDYILGAANYEELSRAAIDKVARCYDPARIAEEYLQVYRRALAQTQL